MTKEINKYVDTIFEIFRRAYKESDPSANFDELIKNGETKKEGWFNKYYLSKERLIEIFNEVCKERKIKNYWKNRIKIEVYLGGSPSSVNPKSKNNEDG